MRSHVMCCDRDMCIIGFGKKTKSIWQKNKEKNKMTVYTVIHSRDILVPYRFVPDDRAHQPPPTTTNQRRWWCRRLLLAAAAPLRPLQTRAALRKIYGWIYYSSRADSAIEINEIALYFWREATNSFIHLIQTIHNMMILLIAALMIKMEVYW